MTSPHSMQYVYTLYDINGCWVNCIVINIDILPYIAEFTPAKVFVRNSLPVFEGDDIVVKCADFASTKKTRLHMYLCKNGIGVRMELTSTQEACFILKEVQRADSGFYSCVHSIRKYDIGNVRSTDKHPIYILVVANRGNLGKYLRRALFLVKKQVFH